MNTTADVRVQLRYYGQTDWTQASPALRRPVWAVDNGNGYTRYFTTRRAAAAFATAHGLDAYRVPALFGR